MSATDRSLRPWGARLSPRSSFWVTSALLFALFGSAAAPAPLYQVYQAKWRFSTTALTVVFAVYVLTLLGCAVSSRPEIQHRRYERAGGQADRDSLCGPCEEKRDHSVRREE